MHLYKVFPERFVRMLLTEKKMECSDFIESSFAKMKAYARNEGGEEGQLFRPSVAGGVMVGHSCPFF